MKKLKLLKKVKFNRTENNANDSNSALVAINYHLVDQCCGDDKNEARKLRRKLKTENAIVSITSFNGSMKIATIYRQITFAANIPIDEINIDYMGRISLLGDTADVNRDQNENFLSIEIIQVGCIKKHLYYWNYPVSTIRAAYKIALVSLSIGLMGFLIALCQLIKCGC